MAEKKTQLKIEVQVKDFATKAFETMGSAVKRFGANALGSIKALAMSFTGLGGILTGVAAALSLRNLFEWIDGLVQMAKEVEDLAGAFGVTVQSMSAMASASKAYGMETETLTSRLTAFSKVVEDAAIGNKAAESTLRQLGLTYKDIDATGGNLVEKLAVVSDGFAKLDGSATKATVATALFGKKGTDMLELLGDGSEKFRRITAEVDALGATLDQDGARNAAVFEHEFAKLKLTFQGIGQAIAMDVLPVLALLTHELQRSVQSGFLWLQFAGKMAQVAGALPKSQVPGIDPNSAAGILRNREPGSPVRSLAELQADRDRRDATDASRAASGAGLDEFIRRQEQIKRVEEEAFLRGSQLREKRRRENDVNYDRELRQAANLWHQGIIGEEQYDRAVEGLREEHARKLREIDGTVFQGFEDGLKEVADKLTDFYAQGKAAAQTFASGLESAFQAATDVLLQDIHALSEAWKAFGKTFIKVLAEMLAKLLSAKLAGLVIDAIFGAAGGGGTNGGRTVGSGGNNAYQPSRPVGGGGGGGAGPESLSGLGGGGEGGGPTIVNNFNISTIDSKDFRAHLAEHSKTIENVVERAVSKGTNRSLAETIGRRR